MRNKYRSSALLVSIMCFALINVWGFGMNIIKGDGKHVSEERPVANFTYVEILTSGFAKITLGSNKLKINTDSNIASQIVTEVSNGVLKIYEKPNVSLFPTKLEYEISLPTLTSLLVSGSADVSVVPFKGDALDIKISGSGDIKAEAFAYNKVALKISGSGDLSVKKLDSKTMDCNISGSGECSIVGTADTSKINIVGSGEFEGKGLLAKTIDVAISGSGYCLINGTADDVKVNISGSGAFNGKGLSANAAIISMTGSGEVYIRVKEKLEAEIIGSGDIKYWGSPKSVKTRELGSGNVKKMGE